MLSSSFLECFSALSQPHPTPYFSFPACQGQLYDHLFQTHSLLQTEIALLRQQAQATANVIDEMSLQLADSTPYRRKVNRIKKGYSKDKACPHSGCCKRYSSRIALNAHIKKTHRCSSDPD